MQARAGATHTQTVWQRFEGFVLFRMFQMMNYEDWKSNQLSDGGTERITAAEAMSRFYILANTGLNRSSRLGTGSLKNSSPVA